MHHSGFVSFLARVGLGLVAFGLLSGLHLAEGHVRFRQEEGHLRLRKQATKEQAHQRSGRLPARGGSTRRLDDLRQYSSRQLGKLGVTASEGGAGGSDGKADNKYEHSLRLRRLKGPTLVRWLLKVLGALLLAFFVLGVFAAMGMTPLFLENDPASCSVCELFLPTFALHNYKVYLTLLVPHSS